MFLWNKNKNNSKQSSTLVIKNIQGNSNPIEAEKVQTGSEKSIRIQSVEASLIDSLKLLQGELENTQKKSKDIFEKVKETSNLVYLGFVVLLGMFAALAFSHLDLIRSVLEKEQQINYMKQETEIKMLKKCLEVSKWLNPKCLEN